MVFGLCACVSSSRRLPHNSPTQGRLSLARVRELGHMPSGVSLQTAAAPTPAPPPARSDGKPSARRVRLSVPDQSAVQPLPPPPIDLPNVLTLLKRPRASLPPVDFSILSSPVVFKKPPQRMRQPVALVTGGSSSSSARGAGHRWQEQFGGTSSPQASRPGSVSARPGSVSARPGSRSYGVSLLDRSQSVFRDFQNDDVAIDAAALLPSSARVPLRWRRRSSAFAVEGSHTSGARHALMSSAGAPAEARLCTQPADTVRAVGHDTLPLSPRIANAGALFEVGPYYPEGGSLYSGGSRPQSLYSSRSAMPAPARPGTAATDVDGGGDASGLGETSPVRAAPALEQGAPSVEASPAEESPAPSAEGASSVEQESEESAATSGETTRSSVESSTADEGEEGEAEEEEEVPKEERGLQGRVGKLVRGRTAGKLAVEKLGPLIKATGLPKDLMDSMRENVRGSLVEKLKVEEQRERERKREEAEEGEEEEEEEGSNDDDEEEEETGEEEEEEEEEEEGEQSDEQQAAPPEAPPAVAVPADDEPEPA